MISELLAIIATMPDMPAASCVGQHRLFDRAAQGDPLAQERAQATCERCVHLSQCRAHAEALPPAARVPGCLGGVVTAPKPKVKPNTTHVSPLPPEVAARRAQRAARRRTAG